MTDIIIDIGGELFRAEFEAKDAPKTVARFRELLPYRDRIIHVRWSGEGVWIPLGDAHYELPWENPTRYPAPGQFIFYPGGYSECEILLAYGGVAFASKLGPLAGIHFLTIIEGLDQLPELGKKVLWDGAQSVSFKLRA